ncbi:tyrosine-type recombinase/integrase, partial [Litchfieldia alkalitelluris]
MNQFKDIIDLYFELKDSPESTREAYSRRINAFLGYLEKLNKQIEDMTLEDVQLYILYLKKERGLAPGTINNYISSIRFFYTYVLEKDWDSRKIPRMKRVDTLPVLPSRLEVFTLLDAIENIKHKAMLVLIYSS